MGLSFQGRVIAFYLPQFHPIPENDEWWGRGFTEWTNAARARPLFPGHYQPHLPADLGFYDLRLAASREAQAELAREYGIHGFCYYHYWFNGRRVLERPFDEVLASGRPKFPFCLCWANENWTRRWDGCDEHVLIEQKYCEEDDREHIRWLVRTFEDERYIRVAGKPLFLVYRASRLRHPLTTTSIWREEARRRGVGEIYLCRVESFADERDDPRGLGFDAAVEFQPDWCNYGTPRLKGGHYIYDYASVVHRMVRKTPPPYQRFPCAMPSWDNSPRRKGGATIFTGSTPVLYEEWLRTAVQQESARTGEEPGIVFVNAWNEWGEGNHLEPCQRWGRAYLEATLAAIESAGEEMSFVGGAHGATSYDLMIDAVRAEEAEVVRHMRAELTHAAAELEDTSTELQRLEQLRLAAEELAAVIPSGDTLILVDEQELGTEIIPGRHPLPFLERDGQYWGAPADDEVGIRELERLRKSGANFVVFAWPAFWWLDHYAGLHRHLRSRFRCVLDNERVVVFDLRQCGDEELTRTRHPELSKPNDADAWEKVYLTPIQPVTELSDPVACAVADLTCAGDVLLEAGCGSGTLSAELATAGRVIELCDFSEAILDRAVELFKVSNLPRPRLWLCDLTKPLPLPDLAVDVVWSSGVLEHWTDDELVPIVREMGRVSRKCVISLVPCSRCVFYRLGKYLAEETGRWPYGREIPRWTLRPVFQRARLSNIHEYTLWNEWGPKLLGLTDSKLERLVQKWWDSLPADDPVRENQGYLLLTVGYV